ncbi:hypothetical protein [Actinomadura madurae]|uniref:hypothetical protein n=1 Tax=Actinomadura madurae TaxID=1993 RepID=UPI0020D23D33|nr:hypothetical protein [Actinomadura madurae]MCQ0004010.1 hypothetical protein [Actinomadura madurae]
MGVAGAAVMALVLLAGVGVHRLGERTGACGQPLELRVLTAPETLTPLRAAAAEFANDGRDDRGCRRYSVTVVAETGPVPLYDGFRLLWRRSEPADERHSDAQQLFGPQPDIWVPSSTAEYDFVPKGAGQAGAAEAGAAQAGAAKGIPSSARAGRSGRRRSCWRCSPRPTSPSPTRSRRPSRRTRRRCCGGSRTPG